MRDTLLNLARVVVSVALLIFVLSSAGLRETWVVLQGTDWRYVILALFLSLVGMVVRSWRWSVLLADQGLCVPLQRLVHLFFVGTFFNNFLPTSVGGDIVKMYELGRASNKSALAVSSVLWDRATGLLTLLAMATMALPFSYHLVPPGVVMLIIALGVGSAVGLLALANRRWIKGIGAWLGRLRPRWGGKTISQVYQSLVGYSSTALQKASVISVAFNALLIFINVLLARSLGVQMDLKYFLLFVPLISTLLVLPFSVSGWGIREVGYVYLFGQAGVPEAKAISISLAIGAINGITGLIGGVLYAIEGLRGYYKGGERDAK
ncbi:MAG: flippase-like domain-containing protein [Chloroflexi bacterium]|nr:flippase-like domain-containing protein [Chloroflexota bacterium]